MNKAENWHNIIKSWQESGEKQTTWCKQNNINISTFKYWKYRLKNAKVSDMQFQELESNKPSETMIASSKSISIEIADARISIYDDINPHRKIIIQVLKSC